MGCAQCEYGDWESCGCQTVTRLTPDDVETLIRVRGFLTILDSHTIARKLADKVNDILERNQTDV